MATVPDASIFRTGRDFAAWIGFVSREDSTGGKQRLGPISGGADQERNLPGTTDRRAICAGLRCPRVKTGEDSVMKK